MIKIKIMMSVLVMATFFASMPCAAATTHRTTHVTHHATKKIKHVRHTHHKKTKHSMHQHGTQQEAFTSTTSMPPHGLISKIGVHMVQFVQSTISTLRYTAYKLGGTHFDRSKGVYIIDCSDYVDHLLQASNPAAYLSLVNATGSDKPTSEHYYHFFSGLTYKPKHYWNKVDNVKELQPGDILVFRNQKNSHTGVSGHVMVVMNKPTRIQNAFAVRVTDSASSGHSQDTRLPHTSGIGIGTMQIKVNPDGEPSAYAWKLGSSSFEHHVNFAMARPIG